MRRVTSGGDNVSQMGYLEMGGSNLEQMLQGAIECRRVLQNRRSQGTGGRARLQPRRTVRVEKWALALVRSMAKAIDGSRLLRRAEARRFHRGAGHFFFGHRWPHELGIPSPRYLPLVSFHKNDNSSAVSFTNCVMETPALCPAFSS